MKILALIVTFLCLGSLRHSPLSAEPALPPSTQLGGEVPQVITVREFNSATLSEASNYYIGFGEDRAIKELKALEQGLGESISQNFDRNERIGWICRIIFKGEQGQPLRQPNYGGLSLPRFTMPLERWPLYPIAESDGVFFVLSQGYTLLGQAERASDYIDYCSTAGEFKKTLLEIPTREHAIEAFDSFKKAERWTMIKWQVERQCSKYTMYESWVLRGIEVQASSIQKS